MITRYLLHITAALFLDMIIGDPVFSLHPVRLIGRLAEKTESFLFKRDFSKTAAGFFGLVFVTAVPQILFFLLVKAFRVIPCGRFIVETVVIYFSLALKDLAYHGIEVEKALKKGNLQLARKRVSFLITRDTNPMDGTALIKASIESISENESDSVIAPLFWGLLFGAPGALAYRTVNTLDAMWGYKTERYLSFGKVSAVLDDILNFIPSRITGFLVCISAPLVGGKAARAFTVMARDHGNVLSPNAGYPEAATAGALGISLGGPGIYFGKKINKKPMGDDIRQIKPEMISSSVKILYSSTVIFLISAGLLGLLTKCLLK